MREVQHAGPKLFVTARSIAAEAVALMEENECTCGFGHEGDDAEAIACKIRDFQPDGLVVRRWTMCLYRTTWPAPPSTRTERRGSVR